MLRKKYHGIGISTRKERGLHSQKEQGELFYVCFVIMSYEILPSTSSKLVGLG